MIFVFMLLLLMTPTFSRSTERCVEIKECKELSWLTEAKDDIKFEKVKEKWFNCPNQGQSFVKCPTIIDEGLSEDEIKNNGLQTDESGTDHV